MSADPRRPLALTGAAVLLATAVTVATPTARAAAVSLPFTNCGSDSPAQVTAIDVSPSPLRAGHDASVTVRGTVRQRVTGGSYDLRVSYLGAPLLHRTGDLADVVRLPIPAGAFALHKRVPVPAQAPPGKYSLTLTAADQRDSRLLCVRAPFQVR